MLGAGAGRRTELPALEWVPATIQAAVNKPMDPRITARALGLSLPSQAYLVGVVLFGLIGIWAYRFGRRTHRQKTRWIGLALMLYPYAVSETWLLYLVGASLCGWVWFDCK